MYRMLYCLVEEARGGCAAVPRVVLRAGEDGIVFRSGAIVNLCLDSVVVLFF